MYCSYQLLKIASSLSFIPSLLSLLEAAKILVHLSPYTSCFTQYLACNWHRFHSAILCMLPLPVSHCTILPSLLKFRFQCHLLHEVYLDQNASLSLQSCQCALFGPGDHICHSFFCPGPPGTPERPECCQKTHRPPWGVNLPSDPTRTESHISCLYLSISEDRLRSCILQMRNIILKAVKAFFHDLTANK